MNSHSGTDITAVELLDGRVVSLRRLGGQDSDAVLALHKHLPDQDLYLRFFTMRPAHLELLAHQLTEINGTRCAVGAFDADRLIGVTNYVVSSDDPQVAEVAIAVAHDDHRVGVGTALLEYLGEVAISRGIRRFTADVLATNHLMLQVLSDAGWPRKRLSENGHVLHFQIELPRHPTSAIGIARRRVLADRKDKRVRHRPNSAQHKGRNSGGA